MFLSRKNNFFDDWYLQDLRNSLRYIDNGFLLDNEKQEYVFELPIPGVKKEEVDVSVSDKTLKIKVNTKSKHFTGQKVYNFTYDVLDLKTIKASIENGLLTVRCYPKVKTETKKIEIE